MLYSWQYCQILLCKMAYHHIVSQNCSCCFFALVSPPNFLSEWRGPLHPILPLTPLILSPPSLFKYLYHHVPHVLSPHTKFLHPIRWERRHPPHHPSPPQCLATQEWSGSNGCEMLYQCGHLTLPPSQGRGDSPLSPPSHTVPHTWETQPRAYLRSTYFLLFLTTRDKAF